MHPNNLCINQCVTHCWKFQLKYYRLPPPLLHQILRVCYPLSLVIAPYTKLQLHGNHVSLCSFFFFDLSRNSIGKSAGLFGLLDRDEGGNPLGLRPGLCNLPLYEEKDGWYSVLGTWNCTTDNATPANQVTEVNQENKPAIPAPAVDRARNLHPGPVIIFCQYDRCSGNRLEIPFYSPLSLLTASH